jgi:hypothetical protein
MQQYGIRKWEWPFPFAFEVERSLNAFSVLWVHTIESRRLQEGIDLERALDNPMADHRRYSAVQCMGGAVAQPVDAR